jgi:hypothetical protein
MLFKKLPPLSPKAFCPAGRKSIGGEIDVQCARSPKNLQNQAKIISGNG